MQCARCGARPGPQAAPGSHPAGSGQVSNGLCDLDTLCRWKAPHRAGTAPPDGTPATWSTAWVTSARTARCTRGAAAVRRTAGGTTLRHRRSCARPSERCWSSTTRSTWRWVPACALAAQAAPALGGQRKQRCAAPLAHSWLHCATAGSSCLPLALVPARRSPSLRSTARRCAASCWRCAPATSRRAWMATPRPASLRAPFGCARQQGCVFNDVQVCHRTLSQHWAGTGAGAWMGEGVLTRLPRQCLVVPATLSLLCSGLQPSYPALRGALCGPAAGAALEGNAGGLSLHSTASLEHLLQRTAGCV